MMKTQANIRNEKCYLNEKEAAELTGMSRAWYQRSRWRGDGPPYIKLGAAVRYRFDLLIDWFENRVRTSTSDAQSEN